MAGYKIPNLEIIQISLGSHLHKHNIDLNDLNFEEREILDVAQSIEGCWLAGGAVLAIYCGNLDNIKDWDLFFENEQVLLEVKKELENIGFNETEKSEFSISFVKNNTMAQLINKFYYEEPINIFSSFDISVCCFAIEDDILVYTKQAKKDVETRTMNFVYTENPSYCIKRIARYAIKGFLPSSSFGDDFANCASYIRRSGKLKKGNGRGQS